MTAPDGAASDYFGYSVSQSGNILAVGAYLADPGGLSNAGAAYLYQLEANGSATYLTKVTAPDGAANDQFGLRFPVRQYSCRRGIQCRSGGLSDAGAAYLYQLEANGSATYLTKVTAPDGAASDNFGYSVSQSGNILAVGAYAADPGVLTDAGAAYLYQLEANGSATYLTKVTAPDGAVGDNFGISVSQSGNILAVGANMPIREGISNAGATYLYQLEANGSATYLTKVTAPDGAANDQFGNSVSQSGNILAVGAYGCRSGGGYKCRSGLSLSIGSQWIRYLPDQGNRSRWSRQRFISDTPFPSRAIFLPSGHTKPIRGVLQMPGQSIPLIFQPIPIQTIHLRI